MRNRGTCVVAVGLAIICGIMFACGSSSAPIVLDTTCSTGPARDPSIPLPLVVPPNDPTDCTFRCGTGSGLNDIAPYSSIPNGSCTGNGTCVVLAQLYCHPYGGSSDELFVCTCVNEEWTCGAEDGWPGFTCPEGGIDAGPKEASDKD